MKKSGNVEVPISKEDILDFEKDTDEYLNELLQIYDQAAYRIEDDLNAFFQRYANEHGLSNAEAKKYLNAKEYRIWKKTIDEYMKAIAADAQDTKLVFELDTLAAGSRITRQQQLLSNIYMELGEVAKKANQSLKHHLKDVIIDNYTRGAYKIQKAARIGFNVSGINTKLVEKIVSYPWSTKTFSKTIWEKTDLLCETLRKEISGALIDGASIQKIIRNVDGVMGRGKKNAARVVRTECKFFANQAQLMSYKKHGIEKYRFIGGGCDKCKALNNQPFDIKVAEPGINYPPIHPNCKCTTVAYFNKSIFDLEPNTRPLDENVKYQAWKKQFLNS